MEIEEYSKKIQFYSGEIPPLLESRLRKGQWNSYMELGCGDGKLLYAVKKAGYFNRKKIFAVDLSKNRIAQVKKNVGDEINCIVAGADAVSDVADSSIDFISSVMVIEHVPDDNKMLAEISRMLSENGTVYLTTVYKKWYAWWFRRCNGRWVLDPTHVREYESEADMVDLIRQNDLNVLEVRKSMIWYPPSDFFLKILGADRMIYKNPFWAFIRNFKVPQLGFYNWELILGKTG